MGKPRQRANRVEVELLQPDDVHPPVHDVSVEATAVFDLGFLREYEQLARLAATQIQPGVRLRDFFHGEVQHPRMIEWLHESNRLARELKGRRDLVKKRRFDVPRWMSGPDLGMPYVKPEFAYLPEHGSIRNRVFRLRDCLEWIVIPTQSTNEQQMPWRPIREVLTHDLVRAILDWKASHLDLYLWSHPHLIGGRICHELPAERRAGRQHIHEVKFSTAPFMRWYFASMN